MRDVLSVLMFLEWFYGVSIVFVVCFFVCLDFFDCFI